MALSSKGVKVVTRVRFLRLKISFTLINIVQSAKSKKRFFLGETRKKQTVNWQFLGETARKIRISRRNFSAFRGENGHHDLGIENVFAAFHGETKTVMT